MKSDKLGLLLGRDFLEAIGAGIDIARCKLTVGSGSQKLLDSENRHFALELKPERHRALTEAYAGKEELPPKLGLRQARQQQRAVAEAEPVSLEPAVEGSRRLLAGRTGPE